MKRLVSLLAAVLVFGSVLPAQTTLPPNRPIAKWDKLSDEIIPKVVAQNMDMGGAVKFFKKATCTIEFSFLTSESRNPITGTFGYWFEDLNENGILTEDEIEVDLKHCSQPLMGYALKEIRRGIRDQTMTTTFNFFSLCNTKTVKKDDGYVMELRPVEGGKVSALLAFEKLYLTVSPDFRVTHIQTRTVDMVEVSIKVKHGKLGPYTVRTGQTQSVEKPSGEKFIDDRSDTWAFVEEVPMVRSVRLDSQVSTIMGTITTRQEFNFTNWAVVKRTRDVPIPGTEDYEALFRGRITADTPLVEVEGERPPVPPPPAPPPPAREGGGVFEDDPPAGGGTGGGVFEDDPPAGEDAAVALGREVLALVRGGYYGWHRQPGRTYRARCVLGATPEQAAASLTATDREGPVVGEIHDIAAYDMAAVFYGSLYGWFLAMDGPLYRPGDAPAAWKATRTADGYRVAGFDAAGTEVEEVAVAADGTVRSRAFLIRSSADAGLARFRIEFDTAVSDGVKFVMKARLRQETPEGVLLDARAFTWAWKRVGEIPFLKRLTVETTKDGQPVTAPIHVTDVEVGP
ncbi:MAG: hypothetical protein MUE73_12385 [Planctomycetes bacterium]|jgi:hypothetical protein|nr:hypothetical protein [Planctomycetota bacterium]